VSGAERRQVGSIFKYGVKNYHGVCETSLDVLREKKFDSLEVADALRLAIIAELDAISLYLQLAKYVDDERVRKVFEDVAREEKAHFGEFLASLKTYDPGPGGRVEGGR
jgi:rubrerythrin